MMDKSPESCSREGEDGTQANNTVQVNVTPSTQSLLRSREANFYRQEPWSIALWLVLGIIMGVLLFCWSLTRWAKTDFSQLGAKMGPLAPGYNGGDFVALLGMYVFPVLVGFCTLLLSGYVSRSRWTNTLKIPIYLLFCALSCTGCGFLWPYCWDSLGCGFFFCVDMIEKDNLYAMGLIQTIILGYFFLCLIFALFSFYKALVQFVPRFKTAFADEDKLTVDLDRLEIIHVTVVMFLILPLCWFFTTMLPNTFENFNATGISKALGAESTTSVQQSEHTDNVYFKSHDIIYETGKYVSKMYPDVIIFYCFLYVVLLAGVALQMFPVLRSMSGMRLPIPKSLDIFGMRGISYGETAFWLTHTLFFVLFTIYWAHDHWYHRKEEISNVNLWARITGQLNNWINAMLLFPTSRFSGVNSMLGISWEGSVRFHRFFGYLFIALTICHSALWYKVWADTPCDPPTNECGFHFIKIPEMYPNPGHDEPTIPLVTIAFWVVLFIVLPATYFRRHYFEFFYFTHMFSFVYIPIVMAHAISNWYFTLPMVFLYLIDRVNRHVRSTDTYLVDDVHVREVGVTSLRIKKRSNMDVIDYKPGQYVFLQAPSISTLQWHPFTIAISPSCSKNVGYLEFQIKNMGTNTFSDSVRTLVAHETVVLDGPYGVPPFSLELYDELLLFAGGIGVTPCHSILQEILTSSKGRVKVHLIWVARDIELFDIFADTLHQCDEQPNATYSLYCTDREFQNNDGSCEGMKLQVRPGRPDLTTELIGRFRPNSQSTLCFVCGPPSLVDRVNRFALTYNLPYHHETFLL